jgi:adenine deaminase
MVNVCSREVYTTDIAIRNGRIVSTESGSGFAAGQIMNCEGMFAVPGLIDPHMHVDTTFLCPGELARILVPRGTTAVFVDTTNIAHTGGIEAIQALQESFAGLPLKGYLAAPSYCPLDSRLETAAVEMGAADIQLLLDRGYVGIGETVWSRIALANMDYLQAIQACRDQGKRVSGHGGELPRNEPACFDAYVAAGIQDDHCLSRGEDILPRLRRGLKLFCVEASGRRGQLKRLLDHCVAHQLPLRQMCLCVDNITVMDMIAEGYGYQDYLVRIALAAGVSPVDVFRMACLNPAEHYRVSDEMGCLAPGRAANILLLQSLDAFPPEKVLVNGELVAERGRLTVDIPPPNFPEFYRRSIRLGNLKQQDFAVRTTMPVSQVEARVIEVEDGDAFNSASTAELPVIEGAVQADVTRDILKIAVVERYGRHGQAGCGFVRGFGLKRGGMATSLSIPSNNIVAVGVTDEDLLLAVEHLKTIQGGFVVVADGAVLADVPLVFGGIMSEEPYETVVEKINIVQCIARDLGCSLLHPFFTMAQTVLSTLPDLGLTDKGLVDARKGEILPVLVESAV